MKTCLTTLISLIFMLSSARATPSEGLRPDLLASGSRLLRQESSAEEFLAAARRLRNERPFTEEENSYLQDLGDKVPNVKTTSLTTIKNESPASEEKTLAERTLAPELKDSEEQNSFALPTFLSEERSTWSQPLVWVGLAGLTLLAGSFALRGKEVRINFR